MVSTRTTKQSKSPVKQPTKKAGGKSHKRKTGVEDTNEESEAESLSDEAIEARVQADLAKLEARKKAKGSQESLQRLKLSSRDSESVKLSSRPKSQSARRYSSSNPRRLRPSPQEPLPRLLLPRLEAMSSTPATRQTTMTPTRHRNHWRQSRKKPKVRNCLLHPSLRLVS